jgi:hypothetical protein
MTYMTDAQSQCVGKDKLPTKDIAMLIVGRRRETPMQAYKCPHCGFWHVGHATPKAKIFNRAPKESK